MPTLRLYLLGPPRIELDTKSIETQRRKALALLIYLAVSGETQRRDTLAALLWPDSDQSQARTALSRHLSELNKVIGDGWLTLERETVSLTASSDLWLDVAQFQQHLADSESDALDSLTNAIDLYRDDFLTGFTLPDCPDFDEWQFFQAEGLRQDFATALERLVAILSDQDDYDTAIPHARRRLALDPLHEPAHRLLMQLYAHSGQQAAALRQYQLCVKTLEDELGVPPSEETTALYERIRIGERSKEAEEQEKDSVVSPPPPFSPAPFPPTLRHNLPSQATPFIGRETELAEIGEFLADPNCHLLTLTGPGGMGKTRLAIEAARLYGETTATRICYVSLAPFSDPERLLMAIVEALDIGLYEQRDVKAQFLDYLSRRSMLLVLDNFEHLLVGAGLVAEIILAAPAIKILITSRERLRLQGETIYLVRGMAIPNTATLEAGRDSSALQLFLQSARRIQANLKLGVTNIAALSRICQLVGGMPLGLELAAGWLDMLSPAEIAAEIERDLDFLASDLRDLPERQRGIRAVFESSWQRLTEAERDAFQKLTAFRGGFTRRAAQQVAGANLRTLTGLVNKSFLQTVERPPSPIAGQLPTRYEVHELLRQFGAEKLSASPQVQAAVLDRFSRYFADFLDEQEPRLKGGDAQLVAQIEIEEDIENIRLAWDLAIQHQQVDAIDKAMESLNYFYLNAKKWFQEGELAFSRAADMLRGREAEGRAGIVLGKTLARQGLFCNALSRPDEGGRLGGESLALLRRLGAHHETATSLKAQGFRHMRSGNYTVQKEICLKATEISRANGDLWYLSGGYFVSGYMLLGYLANTLGEFDEAKQYHQQAINLCHKIGNRRTLGDVYNLLGEVHRSLGELAEAEALGLKSLEIRSAFGDPQGVAFCYYFLGDVAWRQGNFEKARRLCEQSLPIFDEINATWQVHFPLASLGSIACALGNYQAAREYFARVLKDHQDKGIVLLNRLMEALAGAADLLSREGKVEKAFELLVLVSEHEASWRETKDRAIAFLSELEAELPPEVVSAAKEQGRKRNLAAIVEELLAELEKGI